MYDGGILLATDTQHSYLKMLKLSRPKLVRLSFLNAKVGIATAGDVDFALMAAEKIRESLSETNPTHSGIKSAVEEVLLEVYQRHVYPSGMFYENAFDRLLAAWTQAEGLKLFQTSTSSITQIV
jgi:hypothetical protein